MARLSYIVIIIGIALTCVLAEELYSDMYDEIDVRSILENDKLRQEYYNCYLGTGLCRTADAKFFKVIFGEALQTKCRKCTEKQKQNLDIIVDWYVNNKPDDWKALVAKSIEDIKKKASESQ